MTQSFPNSPKDGTYLKDDFLTNSAVADATIGELDWEIIKIVVDTTYAYQASQNGVLRMTITGTNAGDGSVMHLHADGINLSGTNQMVRFRVRYPDISGNILATNHFRIGFSASITATEPAVGLWVDSAAGVIEIDAASTNGDVNQAVAGVSTLTGGTTMIKGTWHEFMFVTDGINANGGPATAKLYVDGELGATLSSIVIGSSETMELSINHWQTASGGDSLELDIDYIEVWLPRN